MSCQECLSLGVPEHLCLEGKSLDVPFEESEHLYRRHNEVIPDMLSDIDSSVLGRIIKLENDSYNRSHFSQPSDVLINDLGKSYSNYGIIGLPLKELSQVGDYYHNDKKCTYSIKAVHVPTDCNYAHCEVHTYIDDERIPNGKPASSAKIFFRKKIFSLIKVIKSKE